MLKQCDLVSQNLCVCSLNFVMNEFNDHISNSRKNHISCFCCSTQEILITCYINMHCWDLLVTVYLFLVAGLFE